MALPQSNYRYRNSTRDRITYMAKRKDDARKTPSKPDASVAAGKGGETHQTASGDTPVLTTQQGIPVADDLD